MSHERELDLRAHFQPRTHGFLDGDEDWHVRWGVVGAERAVDVDSLQRSLDKLMADVRERWPLLTDRARDHRRIRVEQVAANCYLIEYVFFQPDTSDFDIYLGTIRETHRILVREFGITAIQGLPAEFWVK